ncbi:hypothetical protein BGZ58_001303 [Dissophora ornata]|nr:hypothetical protein BGZ58_001303 [Dissophora ornata]
MNALNCIKTPAVSALVAARNVVAIRALSSSSMVAQNIRHELKQASNRDSTWSENQIEKKQAFKGPRFENVDIDAQPQPKAAIELIAEEPIRLVEGRRARCDGGGGSLGHPAVWINLRALYLFVMQVAAVSSLRMASRRHFSSSGIARAEQPASAPVVNYKRPVGGFRGGILGFLLGATVAGGAGYYYLLEEYQTASNLLLSSVEDLQSSTNKVRDYAKKIESVEAELKALRTKAATVEQLSELKGEVKKVYDALNIEHLELKSHVWGLEMDLQKVQQQAKSV